MLELATDEELMEFEEILYGTRFDRLLIVLMLFSSSTEITGLVGLDNSIGFLKLIWIG